jgi:hypothetical protein
VWILANKYINGLNKDPLKGPATFYEHSGSETDAPGTSGFMFEPKWQIELKGWLKGPYKFSSDSLEESGEGRNTASKTFAKDLCDDAVKLVQAKIALWDLNSLRLKPTGTPSISHWSTFTDYKYSNSVYLAHYSTEFSGFLSSTYFPNFKGTNFTFDYCTELLAEQIAEIQRTELRPNVFWHREDAPAKSE